METSRPNSPEPFPREPIPPEIVAWARQTLDEVDFVTQIREMEAQGGGFTLEEFNADIEALARSK